MNKYDYFILKKDLNPIIKKGMKGCILEIWDENSIEVEFVKPDGANYSFKESSTFSRNIIEIIEADQSLCF